MHLAWSCMMVSMVYKKNTLAKARAKSQKMTLEERAYEVCCMVLKLKDCYLNG